MPPPKLFLYCCRLRPNPSSFICYSLLSFLVLFSILIRELIVSKILTGSWEQRKMQLLGLWARTSYPSALSFIPCPLPHRCSLFLPDVPGALDGELDRHCLFRATESQLIPTTFTFAVPVMRFWLLKVYTYHKDKQVGCFPVWNWIAFVLPSKPVVFFRNMVLLIARKHNQPKSQSIDEEVRKMWHIYAMKFYAVAKKSLKYK